MTLPTTVELLLDLDSKRERSLQTELGMSALGGCRRAAGYTLAGHPREQTTGSVQAVMGTAIHELAAKAARSIPGAMAEDLEVHFAGLTGHPDLVLEPILRDLKTTGRSSMLASWKAGGPPQRHQWQVQTYAAALITAGYGITTVQLDYLARDSGETWLWEAPFSMQAVREALEWLRFVREAEIEFLPRDYRPESPQCQGCPFFTACWEEKAVPGRSLRTALFRDDPDAAAWAQRLEEARLRKKIAEAAEDDARGALDALRPDHIPKGGADVAVPGMDKVLHFTQVAGRKKPDMETITADYQRAGAQPPMVQGEPGYRLSLTAPPEA